MSTSPAASPWSEPQRKAPSPPKDLAADGRTAWRRLTAKYEFAVHELDLLAEYCRTLDMLAALRKELAAGPLTVHSPQAGPMINRAVDAIRAAQGELRRLAEAIGFPDPADALPAVAPTARGGDRRRRSHRAS